MIDAVGTTATRTQALRAVMPGRRVALIGLHDEESVFPANAIVRQEINVTGSFAYTGADFAQALDALTRGVLQPGPDWLEERALSEGPAAFAELVDVSAVVAKIVLTPQRDGTDRLYGESRCASVPFVHWSWAPRGVI